MQPCAAAHADGEPGAGVAPRRQRSHRAPAQRQPESEPTAGRSVIEEVRLQRPGTRGRQAVSPDEVREGCEEEVRERDLTSFVSLRWCPDWSARSLTTVSATRTLRRWKSNG